MKEITAAEIRDQLISEIRNAVAYWAKVPLLEENGSDHSEIGRRLNGLAFSILVLLDGQSCAMPCPFSLVVDADDGDQACENDCEDGCECPMYKNGTTLSFMLHEYFHNRNDVCRE